jgi:ankyrin repeat protein
VNWNDHTRKLQEINVENLDFNSLVAFLYSASLPESKYTDFNISLLKQALQKSGNITVLMDGFDEITPTHAEKAAVILSELRKTEVGKFWVTSRPVERERLEKELSVSAFSMKKLSSDSQEEMLRKLWVSKASGRESKLDNFIHGLLFNVGISVRDTHFTGSPLHIIMIATAYEKEMEMCLNSEDVIIPRIDLLKLYTRFVERKLEIYLEDKEKADRTNASVQSSHEYLKKHFIKNFEMCALLVILPSELLNALHNKEIENETKSFLRDVQDGKDNTGIVTNAVEGKPQFVHRTFAEYFTALWFSKNFELNRKVLEHILFDSNYDFVTDMFDRMLTADSPLHCAIIDGDMNRLLTLLDEGRDVNALDKGGRTAVHLVTAKNSFLLDTTFSVYYNDVSLGEPDGVLQWTPMQYATKWKNWDFVERLLESSVHKTELEIFGVKDAGYIGNIIMHAARYGHFSLLESLRRIGVNILQASSEDFLSPLHAAVAYREVQVIKWLIQLGADCNTRSSDGQTLLFHAVTAGSFDVVRALVEEGGASLEVCDDQGRTAIDWANDCASNPKNPMNQNPIMWEYYVEGVKENVKYLRERGCKESSSVCQNNDT